MFRAIALQYREDTTLGELLSGLRMVSESDVVAAKAAAASLHQVDLESQPATAGISGTIDPADMLRHHFLPWRRYGPTLIVAIADPDDRGAVKSLLQDQAEKIDFVAAPRSQIERAIVAEHCAALSAAANTRVVPRLSCRAITPTRMVWLGATLALGLGALIWAAPALALMLALGWFATILVLNGLFKATMLWASTGARRAPPAMRRPDKLPKVSIIVPLLRETDILPRLIRRMSRLVYPRELLEIALVYEESDDQTREHLARTPLPHWMRTIEVPKDSLQTKPRAMNYALDFLRGDIIGIYDAEDAPEPDQVFKVVRRFGAADADVACVQCALDYYNADTNWISRCFTIEYAVLFRVILPGLERLRLPILLGGTSVFFRRDRLEELGRWDAQNVTEDADLGVRLHRAGWRCVLADSTTYEEANFRLVPWIKQRSRWLKGFLVTWLTHMRAPVRLLREVGLAGFLAIQAQLIGTVTSFLLAPVVLPLWLLSFGIEPAAYTVVPWPFLIALICGFLLTEIFLACLGAIAGTRRPNGGLGFWVLTMPLYWPLGAFAAAKALWELFACPAYWDKTRHGINDHAYQGEIDRLTSLSPTRNIAAAST